MKSYTAHWKSPSNIALVKYWGKQSQGIQLPANSSISFTLANCATTTRLDLTEDGKGLVEVWMDGERNTAFEPKVETFIGRISAHFPFLEKASLKVQTHNSFPHSSGIASSASGMSALALCICDVAVEKGLLDLADFERTASELARLGSGSAARSVYGPLAVWGTHPAYPGSADRWAIPMREVHPVFADFCDTILLVHKGSKAVSSTVGHGLILDHPFAAGRFQRASENMTRIRQILQDGDLDAFVDLVEEEALMLHALMLSSRPNFILVKPETLAIIEAIRAKRAEEGVQWCFTLDAGANVHFLFPKADEPKAMKFVDTVLKAFCQDGAYICDQVGLGPIRLT